MKDRLFSPPSPQKLVKLDQLCSDNRHLLSQSFSKLSSHLNQPYPTSQSSCKATSPKKSSIYNLILSIIFIAAYNTQNMNNRQIELQIIIRNLQNKVLVQRQENKILSERYDQKIRLLEEENIRKIIQKEKMIEYLTMELDKDRQIIMNEQMLYDTKRLKEKDEAFREYERYKHKSYELEQKLQSIIEKYQLQKKDLENQIKKYQEKQYDQSFSRASIETEIEKLNKFYHQSRIDQPKRKELIDWAEKLSVLINKTQDQNSKTLQELFSYIKNNLQTFKSELLHSWNNASEFQEQILKSKKDILNDIKQIIKDQTKTKNEMMETNEKLFDILKKEKINSQLERIQQLEKELAWANKRSTQNNAELVNRIKTLQNERKTLLLGFTQLKSLNQSREKTYKDEINSLKQTIQQLILHGQQRQSQFQKQTKMLHNQLTSISQRYYENIQVPLSKISSKLDNEIKVARSQLQKLSENKGFIKTIQNLEEIMQNYIVENSKSSKLNTSVTEYIQKTGEMIYWAHQICQSENQRQLYSKSVEKYEDRSHQQNQALHNKISTIESNIRQVEWKERENKLLYELTTAKKYNKKLKQYCDGLQGKNSADKGVSPIKKSRITSSNTKANVNANPTINNTTNTNRKAQNTAKIFELQAEVEKLQLQNKSYEQEYLYQLNLIKEHVQRLTGKQIKDEKNLIQMQKGIKSINDFNEKLGEYLERQNTHMLSIREILTIINRMFLKPVEIFDNFVEKLTNCYQTPSLSPNKVNKTPQQTNPFSLFANLQEIYKQIYTKRHESNTQSTKLFCQFIKLLRQTTPNHPKPHQKTIPTAESQKQHLQKSRVGTRQSGVEKRIKDLQNLRMKSREETIKRLQKIQETIKAIDLKYSKRHFTNLNRVEESITRKIDQLRQKCIDRLKQGNSEISEITGAVLKDIKNKLKLCINQNQGLTKEVQLLQKFKKKQ